MKKAILYLLIFIALQLGVTYFVMGNWWLFSGEMPQQDNGVFVVVSTAVNTLLTIILFFWCKWTPLNGDYIKTRPWAVLIWSVLAGMGILLPSMWLQEQMPELPDLMKQTFEGVMTTPGGYLVLALLAPLAEEVVFRGAILRMLLKFFKADTTSGKTLNAWKSIAVSALFFALVHGNPAQMPHAFLVGLLLGWMYWRTGSIIPGYVVHVVNNTGAFVAYRLYPHVDKLNEVLGSDTNVLKAVGFSLLILLPSLYQLHVWMKRNK